MAATNRHTDRASVSGILEPVKSRFVTIVELDVHVDDWVMWANANAMPSDLVAFIHFKNEMLNDFKPTREITNSCSPRTIAHVGYLINAGLYPSMEQEVFKGTAGEAFATEFCAFRKLSLKLPSPSEIFKNPTTAMVPKEISQKYAMTGALINAVDKKTFGNFLTYMKRLPKEFEIMAVRDSISRPNKENLTVLPVFRKWGDENASVLIDSR